MESIAEFKQLRFSGPLWSSETAWRLKFGFVRTALFSTNEFVSFHKVPVHTGQTIVQISTNVNIQGASISEITLKPYFFLLPVRGGIRPMLRWSGRLRTTGWMAFHYDQNVGPGREWRSV